MSVSLVCLVMICLDLSCPKDKGVIVRISDISSVIVEFLTLRSIVLLVCCCLFLCLLVTLLVSLSGLSRL